MKKLEYTAPCVEITCWEAEDIITTSGTATTLNIGSSPSAIGSDDVTCSVTFGSLNAGVDTTEG